MSRASDGEAARGVADRAVLDKDALFSALDDGDASSDGSAPQECAPQECASEEKGAPVDLQKQESAIVLFEPSAESATVADTVETDDETEQREEINVTMKNKSTSLDCCGLIQSFSITSE